MQDPDLTPLKNLERRSIVTSEDFHSDEQAGAQFSYLLDNILTSDDIEKILHPKKASSRSSSRKSTGSVKILENIRDIQFMKKYSSFSLIPDFGEDGKLNSGVSRVGTLENIISEERFRKRKEGEESFKMITGARKVGQEGHQVAVFKRIKKKLEDLRRYCPTLYYAEDDIFTIWGNINWHVVNSKE